MMIKVANILGLKCDGRERSVPQHHLWIAVFYNGQWYDVDACPNAALSKQIDPNNVEYVN